MRFSLGIWLYEFRQLPFYIVLGTANKTRGMYCFPDMIGVH